MGRGHSQLIHEGSHTTKNPASVLCWMSKPACSYPSVSCLYRTKKVIFYNLFWVNLNLMNIVLKSLKSVTLLIVIIFSFILMNVILQCHSHECLSDECWSAECHSVQWHFYNCHSTYCYYPEFPLVLFSEWHSQLCCCAMPFCRMP
jgi:hypothetical protein